MVVVVTSVMLWLSWSHRWCYGCHGHIGGVMVVMVASVVLGCDGHSGDVMVFMVASVVLWLSWLHR